MPLPPALHLVLTWSRRHAGQLVLAAGLLTAAVLAGPRLLQGPEVPVLTVVQRDFVQSVVASGRVETPHRVDVGVQITGTVRRVPVVEGQVVTAGAVLIELESAAWQAAATQAARTAQQARARLRQLREGQARGAEQTLREAQANHDAALKALARSRELLAQGFVGQAALDEAQRTEQVAGSRAGTAKAQWVSASPTGSDTAVAQATLAQAEAGTQAAQARLAYTTVRAPVAGTVITRLAEPGDVVQPGKLLLVLSPAGETQIVVQIDERNLHLLRPGQRALALADAYATERFAAELVFIHPSVDAQRGAVAVKLRVPQPPPTLKQDMTVSVDIEVARRAQAVLLPTQALRDADTAAPWVLLVQGGRAQRRAVQTGLRSNGWLEVLQGLRAGDQLVPASTLGVLDGQRLRGVPAP